ncbi:hypothetical protein GUJ93_ZPchr0006g43016 [Zizania palustris]|uniref:Uncharacterized protein n=1 Tax=Zizania palustris TaxID=103762 RepID=A0A8J5T134_ZIZPA|nr:hypothetical protein GUJ93_ZPchr0006g43016 [Zizania palustris]
MDEVGRDAGLCGLPLQALKLCVTFLPFFLLLLLLLGSIKAVLICPVVATIIFFGNSAVVICLWPAHFIWTYYCVLKTERIGLVLKIFAALLLPLLLFLLPILAIAGSLLTSSPTVFLDGTVSTMNGACTVVRDVADFCFHSYLSFMDELMQKLGDGETPLGIKYILVPSVTEVRTSSSNILSSYSSGRFDHSMTCGSEVNDMLSFRRRFINLVKALYVDAVDRGRQALLSRSRLRLLAPVSEFDDKDVEG